jgi:uncharacterized protein
MGKKATGSELTARIDARIAPGARRNSVSSQKEGVWYIKIAAQPFEGQANQELIAYLSRTLDIPKSAIMVIKGQSSRLKTLLISGLSVSMIEQRLGVEMNR